MPTELLPVVGASPVPGAQAANPVVQPPQATQPAAVSASRSNASPSDLFSQGLPDMGVNAPHGAGSNLDFLSNNQQSLHDQMQQKIRASQVRSIPYSYGSENICVAAPKKPSFFITFKLYRMYIKKYLIQSNFVYC